MKLSTFLFKTLKSFRNGKGYTTLNNGNWRSKGRTLIEGLNYVEVATGVKMSNKAKASIAKSLGHTNINGFQTNGFSKVKAVVKAAIKRERAAGN